VQAGVTVRDRQLRVGKCPSETAYCSTNKDEGNGGESENVWPGILAGGAAIAWQAQAKAEKGNVVALLSELRQGAWEQE
jgi:hypothetical protein